MEMKYKCGVCGEKVDGGLLVYISHTQQHIIDEIKAGHPDWLEKDGLCGKCVEYYQKQIKGNAPRG
jgi:DNA-directed RNA polymerase subunit RPC12/RpoP